MAGRAVVTFRAVERICHVGAMEEVGHFVSKDVTKILLVVRRVQATIIAARVENSGIQHTTPVGSVIGEVRALSVKITSITLALNRTGRATPLDSRNLKK